jgi:hypothetical protein
MSHWHTDLGLSDPLHWDIMDARKMGTLADGSVDFAINKGTLDIMIHGSP